MSALLQHETLLSEEAYFQLEKDTQTRYEYIDGYVYAMVGGSFNHGRLVGNIAGEIRNHLKGKACQVFAETTKVKSSAVTGRSFRYFYPDVVVDCSIEKADGNMLTTPVLIVEVLSVSTHRHDETTKFRLYADIPSLQEYVLVEQDSVRIEIQRRRTGWAIEKFFLGDSITFESIGLTVPVEELYDRVQNEELTEWRMQQQAAESRIEQGSA